MTTAQRIFPIKLHGKRTKYAIIVNRHSNDAPLSVTVLYQKYGTGNVYADWHELPHNEPRPEYVEDARALIRSVWGAASNAA